MKFAVYAQDNEGGARCTKWLGTGKKTTASRTAAEFACEQFIEQCDPRFPCNFWVARMPDDADPTTWIELPQARAMS